MSGSSFAGCLRVAQELALQGIQVSSGGVRGVWFCHQLLTRQNRLLRLEQTIQKAPGGD